MIPAPEVMLALTHAASVGLPGTQLRDHEVAPELGGAVVEAAEAMRLTGFLVEALVQRRLVGNDALREAAQLAHRVATRTTMASEASARAASAVLTDGGIDHRLLKGVAVAHADYPDSHVRTFVDADLLVRRADLTVAVAALKRAGLVRANPPVHDWWERRYARAVTMRTAAGFELDLHALLAVGYFGAALPEDPLWSEPADHIHLGGQTVAVLGPAGRLLHAGLNAVLRRDAGPRSLRDLAQLLLVTHAPLERAVQLARAGDAEPVLGEAIIRTWNAFALDPEHEAARWAGTVRPSPRAGRALKLADRPLDAGWAVDARSTLMALGPIDKVLFVAGVAAPSRASMRARGRSIDEHVARGFRVARWNRGA